MGNSDHPKSGTITIYYFLRLPGISSQPSNFQPTLQHVHQKRLPNKNQFRKTGASPWCFTLGVNIPLRWHVPLRKIRRRTEFSRFGRKISSLMAFMPSAYKLSWFKITNTKLWGGDDKEEEDDYHYHCCEDGDDDYCHCYKDDDEEGEDDHYWMLLLWGWWWCLLSLLWWSWWWSRWSRWWWWWRWWSWWSSWWWWSWSRGSMGSWFNANLGVLSFAESLSLARGCLVQRKDIEESEVHGLDDWWVEQSLYMCCFFMFSESIYWTIYIYVHINFVKLFQNLYHVVSLWVVDMLLIYSNCTLNFQFFLLQFGALGSSNLFRQGVFLVDFRERWSWFCWCV